MTLPPRLLLFACLALLPVPLILGCGGSSSTNSSGTSSEEQVPSAGQDAETRDAGKEPEVAEELTLGGVPPASDDTLAQYYGDDPDTLNGVTANDSVSATFQRQVYEPLARRTYENPQEWEHVLAESWDFDPEQLKYTIRLRKGVMWHPITRPDGVEIEPKEFTARDVKFTFDCILNDNVEATSARSYYIDPEEQDPAKREKIKVTVVDNHTVTIQWTKPYFMADEFTLSVQIIPRHVYSVDENGEPISFDFRSKEFADGFNNHWANSTMCGTGPLIFKEWRKGERTSLVRNPNYWGKPFYFSQLNYDHITNPNTAVQKMLQNELDFAGIPETDLYIQTKEHPNVKAGKVELIEFERTAYRYMGYNIQREIFQDKQVRWAISHATPVQQIIDQIYHGLAKPMNGPFLPGSVFSNPDLKPVDFDLDKSRELLEAAGWKINANGVREKEINGKPVELRFDLMIFSDSPQYLSIAEIIKENCTKVGIDVLLSPTDWALMLQKLNKKEFDATILGWQSDWKSDPFQIWHGSQANEMDSSNMGYDNPEVNKLIEQLRVTIKEEDQIPLYHEIHRLIFADQPYTFLYAEKATGGMDSRIENVKFYPMLRPHYDVREWFASKPRVLGR
jgi:ABC-type transport system substrate-binding protein